MVLFAERHQIKLSVCSKISLIALLVFTLTACSHDPSGVVVKELRSPPRITSGTHIVRKDETLYSIAWLYGRDFRELADNNSIRSPYIIHPGQHISLEQRARPVAPPPKRQPVTTPQKQVVKKSPASKRPSVSPNPQTVTWRWPAKGKVIQGFSLSGSVNKGIDIDGNLGEPVMAAAAGEVVYAGSDLAGYGRLIIMKHNNSYLSAYAHNRELLVGEGDAVKAGQKIAEIGSTGTTEPKLHFEIRRDGKPVDPMRFLPKR
ncbi:peptidase M23 [Endozoicomonas montiporae]|uniref:Peptidase M23 n=3 Tax=Endozoicomonas montiporae TaxID=1027273 RepID=A0A081NBQ5_9GAMM|nr:lipoprotein NlpD [Endozoicomonas montiporae CL-33]KEQ15878.1 peptidase M23 [Endozoicomonas montiporae]